MSSFIINIIAKSNLASTLMKDAEAVELENKALAENIALHASSTAVGDSNTSGIKRNTSARAVNNAVLDKSTGKISKFTRWLLHLDSAQNKVGYNIAGFSIRVGAWFMPLMGLMVVSMLPVIASLLAMAAAAGVAAAGLAGVFVIGAALMSRRMNKGGGYAGPRRPYADGSGQQNVIDVLMKPIWSALDSAKLSDGSSAAEYAINRVTTLFETDLPNALTSFLGSVDRGAMDTIARMFSDWLPNAASGLGKWGSKLFSLIGPASLSRFNAFFKWIAGGIMAMAEWLDATDWKYFDQVTALLSDVSSVIMQLGKDVLPTFSAVLTGIWPFPLKPMLEAVGGFFSELSKHESVIWVLTKLAQALVTILSMRWIAGLSASIIGLKATIIGAITAALYAAWMVFGVVVGGALLLIMRGFTTLVSTAMFFVELLIGGLREAGATMLNMFGGDHAIDRSWRSLSLDSALRGEYAGDALSNWSKMFDDVIYSPTKAQAKQSIHVFLHPSDEHILDVVGDDLDVTTVNETKRGTGMPPTNRRLA